MEITIMFDDFKEEKQKEILEAYGIASPEEMNWDVIPFDVIEVETNKEE